MNFQALKDYCLAKQGAREDYPFGPEPLVVKVGSKMFALISEGPDKTSLSLKCDPFLAQNLRQQYSAVTPGYHMNKEHWNSVLVDGSIPEAEVLWMIDHSYERVIKGLTREEKSQIQVNKD